MSIYDRQRFDEQRDHGRRYREDDRLRRRGSRRDEQDDRGPEMSRERDDWEGRSLRGSDTHDSDERFGRREQYDPYFEEPDGGFGSRESGRERVFESFEDWQRPRELGRGASQGRYAGRGPKGYQRSDERLNEDICDRLTADPFVDASEMEISVQGGEVTIQGTVRDRAMKRAAEESIEGVSGVSQVHNRLRVEARDERNEQSGAGGFASARNQEGQRSSAGRKAH